MMDFYDVLLAKQLSGGGGGGDVDAIINNSITELSVSGSAGSVGPYKFYANKNLTKVTVGEGVSTIEYCAFQQASRLDYVDLPSTLSSIGNSGFSGCYAINSLYCRAKTPPTLGSNSIALASAGKIYVPAESVNLYKSASGWSSYASSIQAI